MVGEGGEEGKRGASGGPRPGSVILSPFSECHNVVASFPQTRTRKPPPRLSSSNTASYHDTTGECAKVLRLS